MTPPNPFGYDATQMIDVVVAGAQKSGTTALRHFLGQHPGIGLVRGGGETHFFDNSSHLAAAGAYDRYHAKYTQSALSLCTVDVTPIYLYRDSCLPAIRRYNPNMNVIVLLRDPSERAYSQWIMETERGKETRRFLPALLHEARYFAEHGQHPVYSYVQRGFYDAQIARLHALFPLKQCLVLRTEELWNRHAETLERVFHFLGLPSAIIPPRERVHTREYPTMPVQTRKTLVSIFRHDIKRLENRLGWDLSEWLKV